jgi:hypothetical protein
MLVLYFLPDQYHITIYFVFAENNAITTLSIPKTYFSHLNKELDKKGGGSNHPSGKGVGASVAEESAASGSKARGGSTVKPSASAKSVGTSTAPSSRKSSKASNASAAPSQEGETLNSADAIVGLQCLSELFLGNNKIKTLRGFEAFGVVSLYSTHITIMK